MTSRAKANQTILSMVGAWPQAAHPTILAIFSLALALDFNLGLHCYLFIGFGLAIFSLALAFSLAFHWLWPCIFKGLPRPYKARRAKLSLTTFLLIKQ